MRARALRGGGRRGGAPAGGAPRARPVIERVSGGSCSAARSAQSTRCASWSGRSGPSRPSANARGGAIDAVRGWCAGLGRGVKRLTSAIVHASSAASEVRDVELAHTGHRRRSGAVGVEAGRPRRAPRISARCISRRCGAAAGPALGETSPSSGVPTLGPRLYFADIQGDTRNADKKASAGRPPAAAVSASAAPGACMTD